MKPVFAIDVDGVLADFVGRLCERIRERASWCPIQPHDITQWELSKCMSGEAFKVALQVMNEPGFAYSLDVYEGARELVEACRERATVVALTAPLATSPTWVEERKAWLVEKLGFDPKDIVFCPSKHKARFACDELVEDSTENLQAWRLANRTMLGALVARPWTERCPGAQSLEQIAADIRDEYRLSEAA